MGSVHSKKNTVLKPSMVVYTCNTSTGEVEARGLPSMTRLKTKKCNLSDLLLLLLVVVLGFEL